MVKPVHVVVDGGLDDALALAVLVGLDVPLSQVIATEGSVDLGTTALTTRETSSWPRTLKFRRCPPAFSARSRRLRSGTRGWSSDRPRTARYARLDARSPVRERLQEERSLEE
jgi:hypothetical protein